MLAVRKGENHHWWPRSIQKYWLDQSAGINWLKPDGTVVAGGQGSFGGISDAHNIVVGSGWDSSFERDFDAADDKVKSALEDLKAFEPSRSSPKDFELQNRLSPAPLSENLRNDLASICAGLLLRSPRTRHGAYITANYYRGEEHVVGPRDKLIAANLANKFKPLESYLQKNAQILLIFSNSDEFVFGDGIFSNLNTTDVRIGDHFAFVTLSPSTTLLCWTGNSHVYKNRAMTVRATTEEVERLKDAVLTYSRSFVFYRTQKPRMIDAYASGEHLEYESHREPYFERFMFSLRGNLSIN
jgi:hypothetical protein